MKKLASTLLVAGFVVLSTATFVFAEYSAAGAAEFPFFHLGALIVGGLIIVSLKHKYQKLYLSELRARPSLPTDDTEPRLRDASSAHERRFRPSTPFQHRT